MREIHELNLPESVCYTENHEWARRDGGVVTIGITDYAQEQLGDIVYVEVPEVGASFGGGEECGSIESVKAVASLFIPLSGEIAEVNTALEESPDLVNTSPYGEGWIARVKPEDPSELEGLLDREAYLELLKGMAAE